MKLLIYCDEYPPAVSGGIGSVTKIVAEDLVSKGHDVIVVGTYEYGIGLPFFSIVNGVKIYRLSYFKFLRICPVFFRRFLKAFLRKTNILSKIAKLDFIKSESFIEKLIEQEVIECVELVDYVHLLSEIKEVISFKKFNVPVTMRIHGSISFIGINRGKIKNYQIENDILHFARAQRLTAVSHFSKQFVIENLNQNEKLISVIHNPIEMKLLKKNPSFERKQKTILFYGKIVETKGAFQVVKAFNKLADIYKDWDLILIGGGEIEKAKKLLNPYLQNRVRFTGYLNREKVISAIDASAFCLIPSQFENFSMAPLEVMARGKALIYTSLTSGKEIVTNGYNGLLVNPYNLEEIIESVSELIDNEIYANELAIKGYATVERHFTTEIISKQLIDHYFSLIN